MEDWNEVGARGARSRWRGLWVGISTATLLLVLGVMLFSIVRRHDRAPEPRPAAGDPRAPELAHLQMLGHALRLHADEHEGKFPSAISEIQWRQNLPGMDWDGLPAAVSRFHNPETGKVSDWLYYPGHTENDPPETILVAAPVALGRKQDRRMVVRVNNVAETIAETDFQRQAGEPGAQR